LDEARKKAQNVKSTDVEWSSEERAGKADKQQFELWIEM
jgi:hypothetical protein